MIQFTPDESEALRRHVAAAAAAVENILETIINIGDRIGKEWDPEHEGDTVTEIIDDFSGWSISKITAEAVAERFGAEDLWSDVPDDQHPNTDKHRAGCPSCQMLYGQNLPDEK
jgi:hypothetical protein